MDTKMKLKLVLLMMTLLTVTYVQADQADVSHSTSKKILEIQHLDFWSKGSVDLTETLFTENFVGHFPNGETIHGHEGIRRLLTSHRISFPDWNEKILSIIVEGDRAATHYVSEGTHKGDFHGLAATGNRVKIFEASIYRFVGGRIAEQWAFPDVVSLQQQLNEPVE
jgi:steroid delta-isomerase-like uncharacterized protein